jgi:hypothetical protein
MTFWLRSDPFKLSWAEVSFINLHRAVNNKQVLLTISLSHLQLAVLVIMPLLLPFEVTHPSLREHTSLQGEIQSNQGIIIPASPSVLADVISFTKALEADDDASPTLKAEAAEMRKLVISLTKRECGE